MKTEKILLVRTGGLGDSLLIWPAVRALRQSFPDAYMELMGTKHRLAPMLVAGGADVASDLDGSGYHHLLLADSQIPQWVRDRFGAFDIVIAFSSQGDLALGENLSDCGVGEVHVFLPFSAPGSGVHVARHTMDLLASVGLVDSGNLGDELQGVLPVTDAESEAGNRALQDLRVSGRDLVLVAPGSGSEKKNWFASGFIRVINTLSDESYRVVMIEGPADEEPVERIRKAIPSVPVLRHLTPSVLKGVMSRCRLFIGNDSGLAHLAGLVGAPCVVVFKTSDPRLWRPLGQVQVLGPLSQDFNTGRDVDPDDVMDACHHLLDSGDI